MEQKYKNLSLTWFGDVTSISAEAQYARSLLQPLIEGGAYVKLEPMDSGLPPADLSSWWVATLGINTKYQPGFVKINHSKPPKVTANILGGPNILLTNWDTYNLPEGWRDFINRNHIECITPGHIINGPGVKVTGLEVNLNEVFPSVTINNTDSRGAANIVDINSNTVVYGFTGSWNQRSNIQDLITAYTCEFTEKDNVALLIKTNGRTPSDANERAQILDLVRKIKGTVNKAGQPPVIVLQDIFSQEAMDAIINRIDIYVSAARGGQLNTTGLKCLAAGKTCILPSIGINGALVSRYAKDYPLVVRGYGVSLEPQVSHPDSNPLDQWGRPDLCGLIQQMRESFIDHLTKNPEKAKQSVKLAAKVQKDYSQEASVDALAKVLAKYSTVQTIKI